MDPNKENIEKQNTDDLNINSDKNQATGDNSSNAQKDVSPPPQPAPDAENLATPATPVANTMQESRVDSEAPMATETPTTPSTNKKKVILIIVLAIVASILGVTALVFIATSSGRFGNSCGGNFKEIPIGFSYEICGVKETQTEDILYGSVVYNFKDNENAVFILDELNSRVLTEGDATDERAAAILSNGFGEFFYPNAGRREDKQSEKVETNAISGYENSYTVVANDKSKEPFAIVALAFTLKSNSKRYYAVYMSSDVDEAKRKMNDFVKSVKPN